MKVKHRVSFKTDENGNKYPFLDIGSERHGKVSFRLWVEKELLSKSEGHYFVFFPIRATLEKTSKGSLVLRKSQKFYTYDILVECGFRGGSEFEVIVAHKRFDYKIYESEVGSLGISAGALIVSEKKQIKYKWRKTGRLYGKKAYGLTILKSNGESENFDLLPDGQEAIDELPKM